MPLIRNVLRSLGLSTTLGKRYPRSDGAAELKKNVEKFSRIAVPQMAGNMHSPAPWLNDRTAYVQHYKNSVYIAVSAIARRGAMVKPEFKVKRQDGDSIKYEALPLSHPLHELFEEINQQHTLYDFLFYTFMWRLLTGVSYTWKAYNGFGVPAELWPLPSQWVRVIPDNQNFINQYEVEGVWGQPVRLERGEVIEIAEPNPDWSQNGRYYGFPILKAAASIVDSEDKMLERLNSWFRNYAPPGMVFSGAEGIGDEQIWELYETLATMHALNEQSGRPFVVPEGFKLETGAMTGPNTIDYKTSLDATMETTLATFGVPKAIVGLVKDTNRSNLQGAQLAFVENTLNPMLEHHSQKFTQNLARDFDPSIVIKFPAATIDDAEQIRKAIETATKAGAVTPDEIRDIMLDLPEYETGGDRPLVSSSVMPGQLGNIDEAVLEAEKAEKEEKEKAKFDQQIQVKQQAFGQQTNSQQNGKPQGKQQQNGKPQKPNDKPNPGKPDRKTATGRFGKSGKSERFSVESFGDVEEALSGIDKALHAGHAARPIVVQPAQQTIHLHTSPQVTVEKQDVQPIYIDVPKQDAAVVHVASPRIELEPTPIINKINVETPEVNVTNKVQPTPINVQVDNTVETPSVTVESPTVNVESPTVNVEAPSVTVETPKPQAKSIKLNRGKDGRLTSATVTDKGE